MKSNIIGKRKKMVFGTFNWFTQCMYKNTIFLNAYYPVLYFYGKMSAFLKTRQN